MSSDNVVQVGAIDSTQIDASDFTSEDVVTEDATIASMTGQSLTVSDSLTVTGNWAAGTSLTSDTFTAADLTATTSDITKLDTTTLTAVSYSGGLDAPLVVGSDEDDITITSSDITIKSGDGDDNGLISMVSDGSPDSAISFTGMVTILGNASLLSAEGVNCPLQSTGLDFEGGSAITPTSGGDLAITAPGTLSFDGPISFPNTNTFTASAKNTLFTNLEVEQTLSFLDLEIGDTSELDTAIILDASSQLDLSIRGRSVSSDVSTAGDLTLSAGSIPGDDQEPTLLTVGGADDSDGTGDVSLAVNNASTVLIETEALVVTGKAVTGNLSCLDLEAQSTFTFSGSLDAGSDDLVLQSNTRPIVIVGGAMSLTASDAITITGMDSFSSGSGGELTINSDINIESTPTINVDIVAKESTITADVKLESDNFAFSSIEADTMVFGRDSDKTVDILGTSFTTPGTPLHFRGQQHNWNGGNLLVKAGAAKGEGSDGELTFISKDLEFGTAHTINVTVTKLEADGSALTFQDDVTATNITADTLTCVDIDVTTNLTVGSASTLSLTLPVDTEGVFFTADGSLTVSGQDTDTGDGGDLVFKPGTPSTGHISLSSDSSITMGDADTPVQITGTSSVDFNSTLVLKQLQTTDLESSSDLTITRQSGDILIRGQNPTDTAPGQVVILGSTSIRLGDAVTSVFDSADPDFSIGANTVFFNGSLTVAGELSLEDLTVGAITYSETTAFTLTHNVTGNSSARDLTFKGVPSGLTPGDIKLLADNGGDIDIYGDVDVTSLLTTFSTINVADGGSLDIDNILSEDNVTITAGEHIDLADITSSAKLVFDGEITVSDDIDAGDISFSASHLYGSSGLTLTADSLTLLANETVLKNDAILYGSLTISGNASTTRVTMPSDPVSFVMRDLPLQYADFTSAEDGLQITSSGKFTITAPDVVISSVHAGQISQGTLVSTAFTTDGGLALGRVGDYDNLLGFAEVSTDPSDITITAQHSSATGGGVTIQGGDHNAGDGSVPTLELKGGSATSAGNATFSAYSITLDAGTGSVSISGDTRMASKLTAGVADGPEVTSTGALYIATDENTGSSYSSMDLLLTTAETSVVSGSTIQPVGGGKVRITAGHINADTVRLAMSDGGEDGGYLRPAVYSADPSSCSSGEMYVLLSSTQADLKVCGANGAVTLLTQSWADGSTVVDPPSL